MNVPVVASILAVYFAVTTVWTCFAYPSMVREDGRDHPGWLLGFLFLGGAMLPIHAFRRKRVVSLDYAAAAFLLLLTATGCAFFGWSVAAAFDRRYASMPMFATLGMAQRITTWIGWLIAAAILVSHRSTWRPLRILGWALASLAAGFLFVPVLYAAHGRDSSLPDDLSVP